MACLSKRAQTLEHPLPNPCIRQLRAGTAETAQLACPHSALASHCTAALWSLLVRAIAYKSNSEYAFSS